MRGFDGQFFVRDPRDRYRLDVGAFVQLRLDHNRREAGPAGDVDTTDFDAERVRLILRGHVTKRWAFHFRFGVNADGATGLALGQVTWHATPRWSFTLGEQFIAVAREDWMFLEDLLTTDYSATDVVFGTGVSNGLQALYEGRRSRAYGAISDGRRGRKSDFSGRVAEGEWALTSRYEHQLGTTDWSIWDDLVGRCGRPRGLLLGAGAGYSSVHGRLLRNAIYGTVDASLSWHRGVALAYASLRRGEGPAGRRWTNYGALVQVAQFLTPTVQIYGRYEFVSPGSQQGAFDTYRSLTLGCSLRPFRWTNRARVSLEYARLFTPIDRTIVPPSEALGFMPGSGAQDYLRLDVLLGF